MTLLRVVLMVVLLIGITACGSRQPSVAEKSIVYQGNIYNVSAVKQISSTGDVMLSSGGTRDISSIDRSDFSDIAGDDDRVDVRLVFNMDEIEIVYREGYVEGWGDFRRLKNDWEDAQDDIQDFIADRKDIQLELE
ncbi:MAG: hypothetical protein AAGH65_00535 [Pseudomonadota bacterium]